MEKNIEKMVKLEKKIEKMKKKFEKKKMKLDEMKGKSGIGDIIRENKMSRYMKNKWRDI